MTLSLPGMGQPDPVDGERIHVTVTLDGQPVIEASLTLLWFRTKYAGDPHFLPIYFLPIPLADDGTPEPNTYPPVHVALSLSVLPDGYSPWPGQPTPTPEPFWPATGDVQLTRTHPPAAPDFAMSADGDVQPVSHRAMEDWIEQGRQRDAEARVEPED